MDTPNSGSKGSNVLKLEDSRKKNKKPIGAGKTNVIKTPAKRSLVSNRRFDKVKVERIKAELADDSYDIDYLRLADKFIEHERFG